MSLRLNPETEGFKEFYGRSTEQMQELIADGRVPLSVAGLMQRRLDVRNFDAKVKSSYMDSCFDTGDAVVYHPDGRLKIVLDSQYLREMTPQTQRNDGALVLTQEQYDAMDGEDFKKGELGKTEDWLSKADVKRHPVLKVLARDQALLNDYADLIFVDGKEKFGYDKAMGVFIDSTNGDTPEMRAWFVDELGLRSGVFGRYDLGNGGGRLVGVVPEAQGAKISGVGNVKCYTMADVQDAVSELEALNQSARPESLEKVRSLVGKL